LPLEPQSILEGRYVVSRTLRAGGMGAIYEVVDQRLDDRSALKEMLFEHLDNELFRRKFQDEKQVLTRLQPPAIPRIRDFFMQTGRMYLVMDFIDGSALDEVLAWTG